MAKEKSNNQDIDINEEMKEEAVEEILGEAGLEETGETEQPAAQDNEAKDKELKEAQDRVLRLIADFDNFRKRVQREKEELYQYSSMNIIEKILPVIDNLERALQNLNQQDKEVQNLFSGVEMIYRQLMEILAQEGLKPVEDLGFPFDPQVHEAVMQEQAKKGQEDNEVVEVMRKGYKFKEKLLRPAMVKVAKK